MPPRATSLNGEWTGVYDYADTPDEAVTFTATLFDVGGAVWGMTREPNSFSPDGGTELTADLQGARSGQEIQFRKTYQGAPTGGEAPIEYFGLVSFDGNRIEGQWRIGGSLLSFGGPFVMNRVPGMTARVAHEDRASVSVER